MLHNNHPQLPMPQIVICPSPCCLHPEVGVITLTLGPSGKADTIFILSLIASF